MIDVLDRNMVQECYEACLNDIRELENKRQLLLDIGTDCPTYLVKGIDKRLVEKILTLQGLEYALNNMT